MKWVGWHKRHLALIFLCMLMMAVALTGCGGGNGASADNSEQSSGQSGDLTVSLTDAPGDFASYTVDVLSMTLTKANGAEVEALPLTTRVDFAQYADMTEFLTAGSIPSGVYVSATLTLDYSNADIWVENNSGDLTQAKTIIDDNGNPVTQVKVTVQLDGRNHLTIAPGIPMNLSLDFDLAATNEVTFDAGGVPTVTVDPYLVADVNWTDSKIHRLRGLLAGVDAAGSAFSVYLRPFYAAMTGSDDAYGSMTVETDAATLFDINGDSYQGPDGLAAMAGLDRLTAIVAVGDIKFSPLRFEAQEVYAGSSVPWGTSDTASGSVVARSGDVLTIKGATVIRKSGSIVFNDRLTVQLGDATKVTRQFSQDSYTIGDISVGQRVTVFGTLTNSDPASMALDATAGQVRMQLTSVRGKVVNVAASDPTAQLTMDAQSINRFNADIFDFSGTGADPANYAVNTASLDLSGLAADDPVKVRGFVQPFGSAPPDFNAQTVIDVAALRAFMRVNWPAGTDNALQNISSSGLTLNLDGVENPPHHVFRGGVFTDLTTLGQPPLVAPSSSGTGLYILRAGGVLQIFLSFDDFTASLQSRLSDNLKVDKLSATGDFDDATATLTADLVDIQLK